MIYAKQLFIFVQIYKNYIHNFHVNFKVPQLMYILISLLFAYLCGIWSDSEAGRTTAPQWQEPSCTR